MSQVEGLSVSRRDVLRHLALAVTGAGSGVFNFEAARVVHALAGEERQMGQYVPKILTPREFATVSRLAELIVPSDAGGGSGLEAGAPEFIDLLCSQNDSLADIYQQGVRWFDETMSQRVDTGFIEASLADQTELLDALVEAEEAGGGGEVESGVRFFDWVRRMTVDAYYTSPVGMTDLGYQGNEVLSQFGVSEEARAFVVGRIEQM